MADNVQINPGAGGALVATDDIGGGVQVQRVKIGTGADGAYSDLTPDAPLVVDGLVREFRDELAVFPGSGWKTPTVVGSGHGVRVIRADSTEYLVVNINASHDISGDVIALSVDNGVTWYTAEPIPGGARLLVGPYGDVALVAGVHTVHVRIQDGAEIPVFPAGRLSVT